MLTQVSTLRVLTQVLTVMSQRLVMTGVQCGMMGNMNFLEKENLGLLNWRLQENVFNRAKLFGGQS